MLRSAMQLQILRTFGKLRGLPSWVALGDSTTDTTTMQKYHHPVLDKRSGWYFLIHSGSASSVIPTSFINHQIKPRLLKLYVANATEIDTYSEQTPELNLWRPFEWNFVISNM
jgi:hypothetical protein